MSFLKSANKRKKRKIKRDVRIANPSLDSVLSIKKTSVPPITEKRAPLRIAKMLFILG